MLEHLALLIGILDIETTGARFGLVSFDEISTLDIQLSDHNETAALQNDTRSQPYTGYGRDISAGLYRLRLDCFTISNGKFLMLVVLIDDHTSPPGYKFISLLLRSSNNYREPKVLSRDSKSGHNHTRKAVCIPILP